MSHDRIILSFPKWHFFYHSIQGGKNPVFPNRPQSPQGLVRSIEDVLRTIYSEFYAPEGFFQPS